MVERYDYWDDEQVPVRFHGAHYSPADWAGARLHLGGRGGARAERTGANGRFAPWTGRGGAGSTTLLGLAAGGRSRKWCRLRYYAPGGGRADAGAEPARLAGAAARPRPQPGRVAVVGLYSPAGTGRGSATRPCCGQYGAAHRGGAAEEARGIRFAERNAGVGPGARRARTGLPHHARLTDATEVAVSNYPTADCWTGCAPGASCCSSATAPARSSGCSGAAAPTSGAG